MKYLLITVLFIHSNFSFSQTENPEKIVQEQVEAYNNKNLEEFLETYSDNVKVYDYPNTFQYEGKTEMRKTYGEIFKNIKDLHCEIKKRIVIGDKIIDEEYITANGTFFSAVAIYEVKDGKIFKVTFMR